MGNAAGHLGKRIGIAAAIVAATAIGYAAASLIQSGPAKLRERTPFAAVRSFFGEDRGRAARAPTEIPPKGWWEILQRVAVLTAENRLMAEAAAVAFYSLLAVFPALTALVSLYGLFADPAKIDRLLDALSDILPSGGLDVLRGQLHALVANGHQGLSVGVAIGLAAALWSANQGSKALFEALNVVYREREKRSYPTFVLVAMGFTLGAMVFAIVALICVVALPEILRMVDMGAGARGMISWARWPVILVAVAIFLANLYRFGPSRANPKWRWVSWGGGFAAISWVLVSFAFSWYVQNFGSFDKTYGSLGAVVGFMVWMWLSALVALVGAQLNSEMEHQTAVDTTTGDPLPLGLRGATQADTVA